MVQRKRWSDLTRSQQTMVLVGASIELALTMTALADLVTAPSTALRGPRAAWLAALVIQPIGPVAYLTVGRRRREPSAAVSTRTSGPFRRFRSS